MDSGNRDSGRESYSSRASDQEIDIQTLDMMLSRTWSFYAVSPLYRLNFSAVYLKRAAKWLREQISFSATGVKKDAVYKVTLTKVAGFKANENDSDALKINVTCELNNKNSTLYEGIFLSRGRRPSNKLLDSFTDTFTYLPTLFTRSSVRTATVIHGLLQKLFDCKINKLDLPSSDLEWLTCIFATNTDLDESTIVIISYSIADKEKFKLETTVRSLYKLWSHVHNPEANIILDQEVQSFHQKLSAVVKEVVGVDVQYLNLSEIKIGNSLMLSISKINTKQPLILDEFLFYVQTITHPF